MPPVQVTEVAALAEQTPKLMAAPNMVENAIIERLNIIADLVP